MSLAFDSAQAAIRNRKRIGLREISQCRVANDSLVKLVSIRVIAVAKCPQESAQLCPALPRGLRPDKGSGSAPGKVGPSVPVAVSALPRGLCPGKGSASAPGPVDPTVVVAVSGLPRGPWPD